MLQRTNLQEGHEVPTMISNNCQIHKMIPDVCVSIHKKKPANRGSQKWLGSAGCSSTKAYDISGYVVRTPGIGTPYICSTMRL